MHAFTHVAAAWALPGIIAASALGALVMCLLVFRYGFPAAEGAAASDGRFLVTRLGHAFAGTCFAVSAMLAVVALSQPLRAAAPLPAPVVADTSAVQAEIEGLRQQLIPIAAEKSSLKAEVEGLRRQLAMLEGRLGQSDTRLSTAESRLTAGEERRDAAASRADKLETRVRATEVALRQVNADTERALAAVKQLNTRPAATAPPVRRPTPEVTSMTPAPKPAPAAAPQPSASPPSEGAERPLPEAARPPAPRVAPAPPRAATAPEATTSPAPAASAERPLVDKLRDDWQEVKRDSKTAGEEIDKVIRRIRGYLKLD